MNSLDWIITVSKTKDLFSFFEIMKAEHQDDNFITPYIVSRVYNISIVEVGH